MYAQNCVMRRSCASFLAIAILTFGLLPLVGAQAQQDTRRSKTAGASEVAQQPRKFVPGELLVGYKTEADRDKATKALTAQRKKFILPGGKKARRLTVTPMSGAAMSVRIELPRSIRAVAKKDPAVELKILQETAETLRQADDRITYAHPNWVFSVPPPQVPKLDTKKLEQLLSPKAVPQAGSPNDPLYQRDLHWHYGPAPGGMNAVGAWNYTRGESVIVVAVLDTGLLFDHSEVKGSDNVLRGYNFVSQERGRGRGPDATDTHPSAHGSHVAGTIGAVGTDNSRLMAGLNWRVSILPVRVLNSKGRGNFSDLADGVRWASGLSVRGISPNEHPASVINMSLAGKVPCINESNGYLIEAINAARENGSVIVAAAGNDSIDVKDYSPAGCSGVISVAAHDQRGRLTPYSNHGNVSIMAPGGNTSQRDRHGLPAGVWSLANPNRNNGVGVRALQGTSMAAPHVAGAIALALSVHPEWRGKPDLIAEKLRASVRSVESRACPKPCGPGQLDAERLLLDSQIAAPRTLQEEKPFGGPPPSTIRGHERDTTMAGPHGAKPAGTRTKDAQRARAPTRASGRNRGDLKGFDGQWQMADGGALEIEGNEWHHPALGIADLFKPEGSANYEVQYRYHRGATCTYRIKKTSDGHSLILEPADFTQPVDYCPSGTLPKVGS